MEIVNEEIFEPGSGTPIAAGHCYERFYIPALGEYERLSRFIKRV